MDVKAWLYAGLRTGAQALWALLAGYAASRGIQLPEVLQGWFVDVVITASAVGAATAGLRWLETRNGEGAGARLARFVAKILMLGLSAKQPVYATPDTRAASSTVKYANGNVESSLRE